MHRKITPVVLAMVGALLGMARAEEAGDKLDEHLKPLAAYVGKTWKGEFVGAKKPTHDVSRWERALNGKAVRILHSVNDGQYGGESIVIWDVAKKSLVYWYFTTAGFVTQGTMKIEEGKLISHETVTGNASGITEVKSEMQLLPDGRLHAKSQYLKDGKWIDGREVYYTQAPDAKVVFK